MLGLSEGGTKWRHLACHLGLAENRLSWARHLPIRHLGIGSARLDLARLELARLGSAQPGSSRGLERQPSACCEHIVQPISQFSW